MRNCRRNQPCFSHTLSLLVGFALLTGCAATPDFKGQIKDLSLMNKELSETNRQLMAELDTGKTATARLQLELVEKEAEITRLKKAPHHEDPKELLPALRMPPPGNKVEAAIYLAEVETEISSLRETANDKTKPLFLQADRFLAESKDELGKDNIDKAAALAAEAIALVRIPPAEPDTAKPPPSFYTKFISPVQLELAKRANIRQKPSIRSKLLTTRNEGTPLTATGYTGNWLKVVLEDDTTGWVYYLLLKAPNTLPTANR